MTNAVLLNSVEHSDLRVITDHSAEYGDDTWYALTFPLEFRMLQASYPIFFQKDPRTGKFMSLALLGFTEGENLYLNGDKWSASYIPLTIRRQPFLIGRQKIVEDGQELTQRVIHIDLDNPRVSREKGEPLFMEFGGNSPYLDKVADMLEAIHQGLSESDDFIQALLDNELLESFTADITLNTGDRHQLVGFYTINEDRLRELDADKLAELHRAGYLESIYYVMASQSNMRHLIDEKSRRVAAQ